LATASTRTTTRAPSSCRKPATKCWPNWAWKTTRCSSWPWQLEKIALEDDYFVQRKLYPNVDFYSGIVQRAIGIPVNLFTAIFALARTVGWIAQLNEMIGDPEYKIGRPRQLFTQSATLRAPLTWASATPGMGSGGTQELQAALPQLTAWCW
jgi:hypothetical protein